MGRAKKACSAPRCPNLEPCPTHRKEPWAGSNRRSELPGDWESRRKTVLARDPVCTECDNALSTDVHHVGDRTDHRVENLAGICRRCHNEKTQEQAAQARRNADA